MKDCSTYRKAIDAVLWWRRKFVGEIALAFLVGLQRCRGVAFPSVWSGRVAATPGRFDAVPLVGRSLDYLGDECVLPLVFDIRATRACRFDKNMCTMDLFRGLLIEIISRGLSKRAQARNH